MTEEYSVFKVTGFRENNNFWKAVDENGNFNNLGLKCLKYDVDNVLFHFNIIDPKVFFLIRLKYEF